MKKFVLKKIHIHIYSHINSNIHIYWYIYTLTYTHTVSNVYLFVFIYLYTFRALVQHYNFYTELHYNGSPLENLKVIEFKAREL
jgi:hypothetical protein